MEVIQAATTAMAAGIDVATLAGVRFAYPTYSAVIGMAARGLLAETAKLTPLTESRLGGNPPLPGYHPRG